MIKKQVFFFNKITQPVAPPFINQNMNIYLLMPQVFLKITRIEVSLTLSPENLPLIQEYHIRLK